MVKKTEISKVMGELSRKRWAGKSAKERSEAARRAGLGNAKRDPAERSAIAKANGASIGKRAARARAKKAAATRAANKAAAEAAEAVEVTASVRKRKKLATVAFHQRSKKRAKGGRRG